MTVALEEGFKIAPLRTLVGFARLITFLREETCSQEKDLEPKTRPRIKPICERIDVVESEPREDFLPTANRIPPKRVPRLNRIRTYFAQEFVSTASD